MILVDQEGIMAFNLNNVESITYDRYEDDEDWEIGINGYRIGAYPKERTLEIYNDLINKWAGGGCPKYVMPKE